MTDYTYKTEGIRSKSLVPSEVDVNKNPSNYLRKYSTSGMDRTSHNQVCGYLYVIFSDKSFTEG